jgi:hypothetical protein
VADLRRLGGWQVGKPGSVEDGKVRRSEGRKMNSEEGPAVVPKKRDYAAARMRKVELEWIHHRVEGKKVGRSNPIQLLPH